MDGAVDGGGHNLAPRPMEMLLAGTGGCTAYDVVLSNSATAGRPYPAKSEEAPNAMRCTGGRRRSAANSRPARCC
ncbi:hypothetical protein G6F50_018492 [Rhizopus delemar]|uniref:Peroxiredoxin n=1 Tax=Rhizopus delemar TaxID=936053 RepID=A0A9P7BYP8_9FUNG|nr:hypothetical protein G6F50_018492 [Rhizopus delemar]